MTVATDTLKELSIFSCPHERWRLGEPPDQLIFPGLGIAFQGDRISLLITGELCGAPLRAAYSRADLMVLASPREGFGIVCLEAMHCGLPVIASNDGAAPELTEHEEHALLVDPTDSRAFAATLQRVFAEPHLLPAVGNAARARALRHPT